VTATFDGICELVLESADAAALVDFYERLGLEVVAREGDRVWFEVGPRCRLGIWTPGEKEHRDRGGAHVHFALSVGRGEIDAVAARLRAIGGDFEGPVEHDGGDRSIYAFDPAGNRLELWDYFEDHAGAPT
jgi:catechol 2,3-dioxygenase-like lactoylglutathione lyase family enzyme